MDQTEVSITCPYCWESIVILTDPSVPEQEYVEDCQVCCNPIDIRVQVDHQGAQSVQATNPDDA